MIKIKNYTNNNLILTKGIISNYINKFWQEEFSILNNKHLLLMLKVQYSDETMGYRTLGHLRKVNFSDKEMFINYIVSRLGVLNESYQVLPINLLSFTYLIKEGLATDNRALLNDSNDKALTGHNFNKMQLPVSMNPSDYGRIIATTTLNNYVRYIVDAISRTYEIDVNLDNITNKVRILGAIDLNWIDTKISESVFKRVIGQSTIYFMDGEIVLRKQMLPAKEFRRLKTEKVLNSKFVTFDIETVMLDKKQVPYLISVYNGSTHLNAFISDVNNQELLFNQFINNLLTFFSGRLSKLLVYAHNLSSFDGLFVGTLGIIL